MFKCVYLACVASGVASGVSVTDISQPVRFERPLMGHDIEYVISNVTTNPSNMSTQLNSTQLNYAWLRPCPKAESVAGVSGGA